MRLIDVKYHGDQRAGPDDVCPCYRYSDADPTESSFRSNAASHPMNERALGVRLIQWARQYHRLNKTGFGNAI